MKKKKKIIKRIETEQQRTLRDIKILLDDSVCDFSLSDHFVRLYVEAKKQKEREDS